MRRTKQQLLGLAARGMPGFKHFGLEVWTGIGEPVLRGYCIERSRFSTYEFKFYALMVPIYKPTTSANLNHSLALKSNQNSSLWYYDPEDMEQTASDMHDRMIDPGLQFLSQGRDVASFLRYVYVDNANHLENEHVRMTIGTSYAMLGDFDSALQWLEPLSTEFLEDEIEWTRRLSQNAGRLVSAIRAGAGPAREVLDTWSRETLANLGIVRTVPTIGS